MYIDFAKKRKEGRNQFKLFGVVSCKACAEKWKHTLQQKGRKVRLVPKQKRVEVWIS